MVEGSAGLKAMSAGLGVLLVMVFAVGVRVAWVRTNATSAAARRAGLIALTGAATWAAATAAAAASGRLSFESRPPTMMLLVAAIFAVAFTLGLSRVGARLAAGLPLAALVGVQGFRLPLELAMHRAAVEGVMPPQMSYTGYNFDILTGTLALAVAWLVATDRAGTRLVRAWNWLGVLLLSNVLIIAMLSTPLPFRLFTSEPANVWITTAPFVWLPAIMVLMAILGHVVVFRRLRLEATGTRSDAAPRGLHDEPIPL
jgi:hypothetical protein